MRLVNSIRRVSRLFSILLLGFVLLGSSSLPPGDQTERVRAFTRHIEFDYVGWTLDALRIKLNQFALGADRYLAPDAQRRMMLEYLELVSRVHGLEAEIALVYADPAVVDQHAASQSLRQELEGHKRRLERMAPVAEAILQSQIGEVVAGLGLTLGGQPVPPVLYHGTSLPKALIISPRHVIRQDNDISITPELSIDQYAELEDQVDRALNVSSLTVNIGGVGLYPTMVYQTSDMQWLSEVVAHEWVHNFLTLRPLGFSYMNSPELRIMNETAANIAGKEIGLALLERYYPELLPPPPPPVALAPAAAPAREEPAAPLFDYYLEMRNTRVTVDQLLAEGKIDEAEQYMQQRRVEFWNHGFRHLRKLNQAYFAFYGAYADHPSGGAAGEDPVGAAVRRLRAQTASLSAFLNRISWMSSFEQLQRAVDEPALNRDTGAGGG